MKYIYSIILLVCLISFTGISQPTYWWELKQSGSSLGGPIDVLKYDTDVVYYGSDNKIYKSIDRGETFSQTGTNVPGASEIKSIILDDFNPGTFLIAMLNPPATAGPPVIKILYLTESLTNKLSGPSIQTITESVNSIPWHWQPSPFKRVSPTCPVSKFILAKIITDIKVVISNKFIFILSPLILK